MAYTGAKTNLFEDLLLNHLFRGGAAPATGLYIGLVTGDPTLSDAGAETWHSTHEIASPAVGYFRQDLGHGAAANMMMGIAVDGTMSLTGEINFGTSDNSAGWGDVTGFIISTSQVIAATGTYYYGTFDTAKSVSTGDSVRITATNLTIEER
jgi:hypothetical protein